QYVCHFLRNSVQAPVGQFLPAQKLLNFIIAIRWTQKRMIHLVTPFVIACPSTLQSIDPERGSQGRAGITCRRLHPDMFERTPVTHPGVHHTVESNTTSHTQVITPCSLVEPVGNVQD